MPILATCIAHRGVPKANGAAATTLPMATLRPPAATTAWRLAAAGHRIG